MKNNIAYKIGGLLYIPATNKTAAAKIVNKQFPNLTSVCFCLEDSIGDNSVEAATKTLAKSLSQIETMPREERPIIFIRVRSPKHMMMIYSELKPFQDAYDGYVLPKFDETNSEAYIHNIQKINGFGEKTFYVMPILESKQIANIKTRTDTLVKLKSQIDQIKDIVPNIRVGGNDFCNLFGIRRNIHQTIYDIGVVRDILVDIINVFSTDYVVSGPVWEYFGKLDNMTHENEDWAKGLIRELELGKLNGFTGKTVIHPSQLPIIANAMKVSRSDYEDAIDILNWSNEDLGVQKTKSSRMNEVKCHMRWAMKIKTMGDIYGIRENE